MWIQEQADLCGTSPELQLVDVSRTMKLNKIVDSHLEINIVVKNKLDW